MNNTVTSQAPSKASNGSRLSWRVTALAAVLACVALSGCVIVSDSHVTTTGHKIDDAKFSEVGLGNSKDAVLGLLGDPSEKIKNDNGTERWTWRYTENHRSSSGFIVLFASSSDNRTVQTRNVEFKDGVATRVWSD